MPAQKNKHPSLRFFEYWVPLIIYAGFIFFFSSIPGDYTPKLFAEQDVIFHIIEYAFFSLLFNRAFKEYNPASPFIRRFCWVFFFSMLYALSDEFHQAFIPNRFPSLFDLAYDGIGIFMTNIFYR